MKAEKHLTSKEFHELVERELSGIQEVEYLILKGHILVEYALNWHLEAISHKKDADFFNERLKFSQKISLLEHFSPMGKRENDFAEMLKVLNKLRNGIAHNLQYESDHIKTLHSLVSKNLDKTIELSPIGEKDTLRRQLQISLNFILGAMFAAFKAIADPDDLDKFLEGN